MSTLNQASSWLCSLHTTKSIKTPKSKTTHFLPKNPKFNSFKTLKFTAFALNNSKEESLPEPTSSNVPKTSENSKPDRIKLAFELAQKYKKSSQSNEIKQIPQISDDPVAKSAEFVSANDGGVSKVVPVKAESLPENGDDGKKEVPEAVSIALEKSREYKKNKEKESEPLRGDEGGGEAKVPEAIRIAMEKASKYKQSKGVLDSSSSSQETIKVTGSRGGGGSNKNDESSEKDTNKREDLKISSIDFVGLNFADKKSGRGLPAGLVPVADPFPDNEFQEVEIIVGDSTRFGNTASVETEKGSEEESSDLYKPKVSTWGMFPRPSNISETFGGGRTIRPGEALETAEDKAAKEAQTRQLLAAYKRKFGLNMDPKLRAECEKSFRH